MTYNSQASRLFLGCLMQSPTLVKDERFNISKNDFAPNEFHLRLYQAIDNLAKHGAKDIDAIDLYGIAEDYTDIKSLFDTNDLKGFVSTVKELANTENIDLYYNDIRKTTLLREYENNGFDISRFEDNVSNVSIKDIVDYYDTKQSKIKNDFYRNEKIEEVKAGDNWESVKESFKTDPMYGASSFSTYLNEITRGFIRGQLTIYSAVSGSGKTTIGLYQLVKVCCKRIWSFEDNQYIDNPCYQHSGGLYIQYELDIQRELTPKILASISGVPTYNILDNNYQEGEEERVDEAIKILHKSEIYFVTMPNYTITLLQEYIKRYTTLYGVNYIVMDYISETLALANEYASGSKTSVRTDQVLAGVAGTLKNLATKFNCAILSFTQTNANATNSQTESFDAGVISGSRAIQNCTDICGVIAPIRKSEQEIADMMSDSGKFNSEKMPNRIIHLFKMRFSKYPQSTKVWINLDLNTGRIAECFCTTSDNKPISVPKLNLIWSE